MLNLIPENYKKVVKREYLKRFTVVALSLFSFTCIVFGVSIFPTYISARFQEGIIQDQLNELKSSPVVKDKNTLISFVSDLEQKMKLISEVKGKRATVLIQKVLDLKTQNVSITDISYSITDSGIKNITIGGTANSRNGLIDFYKKIKNSDLIVANDIPISNLASDNNIPFTLTLTASSTNK